LDLEIKNVLLTKIPAPSRKMYRHTHIDLSQELRRCHGRTDPTLSFIQMALHKGAYWPALAIK